jgi:hypothetical protein
VRPLALLAGCALAQMTLGACRAEPAWEWRAPEAVDAAALLVFLRPRGGEELVLANFWATW